MGRVLLVLAILVSTCSGAFGYQEMSSSVQAKPRKDLRIAPGKLLAEGTNKTPGARKLSRYTLEEVALSDPVEQEIRGKKETVASVFRLIITGGESLAAAQIIWIGDAALTELWSYGPTKVGAIIFDRSILTDGAEVSVSNRDGTQLETLSEPLRLPVGFEKTIRAPEEEGNSIAAIRSTLRILEAMREHLIQIEMRTSRAFPIRNARLEVQIGKQFFVNQLAADTSGYGLTLSLSPEQFASLKDGADVLAFYNSPNRSGTFARDIWYFGRLDKGRLDK
jgi:hypothetical protein